tara:strand:- start:824 stop:1972 length:1149 start_codon:yes stop_codon:yes gene_type:complete
MKKKVFTVIGVMTGTSMDGIDLSLIKTDGYAEFTPILNEYFEFDEKLRNKLINLRNKISNIQDLETNALEQNNLERDLTIFHNVAINKIISKFNDEIDLIGVHGQTIFHDPKNQISVQLGDARLLSQFTKKIVINNFREQDLKNGGNGAPLTPIFHNLIGNQIAENFKIPFPLNIINIGGITNVTKISENHDPIGSNLQACDIGPGNCLIDEWVRLNSNKKYDKNGDIAKSGKVNNLVLNQAIENFRIDYTEKSLDVKDFDISFVRGLSLEDGCATLTRFSAHLIAQGIEYVNKKSDLVSTNNFVCGGGRKNRFLISNIIECLKNNEIKILNIDDFGFNGDFVESQCFGYLAVRNFLKLPSSFPQTTGCKYPTIGGTLTRNF